MNELIPVISQELVLLRALFISIIMILIIYFVYEKIAKTAVYPL